MSCGRHWYFFCMWHLHLIFAARFSNMPYFRQSLSCNAIMKFYQIWYIAKHFVFMLIIFQVDRHSVSIRFFCVWKKIPLLLNRTVCGNSVIIFTVISGTKPFVLFHALLDIFWSEVPNTNQAVHITLLDHFPVGRIIYSMRLRSPLQVGLLTDLISF